MTGKDLVLFILNNDLLDEQIEDIKLNDSFLTIKEAAIKLGIGYNSLSDMIKLGLVDHIDIDGETYVHKNIDLTKLKRR